MNGDDVEYIMKEILLAAMRTSSLKDALPFVGGCGLWTEVYC